MQNSLIKEQQPLTGYRVLDLSGPMGVYCGKLMADMGADVIKVEPPGGDPMRRIGPFLDRAGYPEHDGGDADDARDYAGDPAGAGGASDYFSGRWVRYGAVIGRADWWERFA